MSTTDPDPPSGLVGLRPLTLSAMIAGALRFLTRQPRAALSIGVIAGFASAIANIVGLGTVYPGVQERLAAVEPLTADPAAADQSALAAAVVELLVSTVGMLVMVWLISVPVLAIANAMLIAAVGADVSGQPVSAGSAWASVRPKFVRVLALWLVILATVGLCALPLVISMSVAQTDPVAGLGLSFLLAPLCLGALLMVLPRLVIAPVCLVLEDQAVAVAFIRARELAKGHWARIVGIAIVALLFSRLVGAVVGLPFDIFAGADPLSTQAVFFTSLGRMAGTAVSLPLLSAAFVMLYVDLRVRGEGLGQS